MKFRLLVITVLLLQSCASIVDGTLESRGLIYFSSSPTGATVRVNGVTVCTTPCQYRVANYNFKYITMSKGKFQTVEIDASKGRVNEALAGNLIFGGGLGLALDLVGGRAVVTRDAVNVVFGGD